MTKREWKIGDVALRTCGHTAKQMLSLVVSGDFCPPNTPGGYVHPQKPHWHHADGGWDYLSTGISTYHRLVVIDPEDREVVERLLQCVLDTDLGDGEAVEGEDITEMQGALREFANPTPPKPEEPTGLGAVVEDSRGVRWVRTESAKGITNPWSATLHTKEPDHVRQLGYTDIDAIKILSDGVSDGS